MRRRYFSAPALHSPHVLKATQSCFRLKMQMCSCIGDVFESSTTTTRRGFVLLRRLFSLMLLTATVHSRNRLSCYLGCATGGGSDCLPRMLTRTMRASWTCKLSWNYHVL